MFYCIINVMLIDLQKNTCNSEAFKWDAKSLTIQMWHRMCAYDVNVCVLVCVKE